MQREDKERKEEEWCMKGLNMLIKFLVVLINLIWSLFYILESLIVTVKVQICQLNQNSFALIIFPPKLL